MKEIEFSNHAELKIKVLKQHRVEVNEDFIKQAVISPDKVEKGYKGRMVAQKRLDERHVLRVVYEDKPEHILIITLYPGRRERYEKD